MIKPNGYIVPLIATKDPKVLSGKSRDMVIEGTLDYESDTGLNLRYLVTVTVFGAGENGEDVSTVIDVADEHEFVHEWFFRTLYRWVENNTVKKAEAQEVLA